MCDLNLQDLCLHTIVENFEQHFTLFSTTEDAKIKRMFKFLQRVYSDEFADLFYKKHKIEDKYLDFLINAYLKSITTFWFKNCQWKSVIAKMAEFGANITAISIAWYPEEITWDELFCYLPNLERILIYKEFLDEIISCVAKFCPNILEIDAQYSYCTEECFKYLYEVNDGKVPCQNLKRLFIDSSYVAGEEVQCLLKNLPMLEVCDHKFLPLVLYSTHSQDVLHLDKIKPYKIVQLDFFDACYHSYKYGDVLKVCVTLCPYTTCVHIPVRKPSHLDTISKLQHLKILHLENFNANFLDLNDFIKSIGRKLTSLTVQKCSLSVLTLAESAPLLKYLVMVSVNLENHRGAIPQFHSLETFNIRKTEFGSNDGNCKAFFSILSSSPNLDCIKFKKCNLSSFEIRREILKFCELNSIKSIEFCHSSIDKHFIMNILLTCQSLRTLHLRSCDFGSDDAEEIFKCSKILPNSPRFIFSQHSDFTDFDDLNECCEDFGHDTDDEWIDDEL